MVWDFCAWVGIAFIAVIVLKVAYFTVESLVVARVGWTRWYRWRREMWAIVTFSTLPEDPNF
jgi:hypothetical protein